MKFMKILSFSVFSMVFLLLKSYAISCNNIEVFKNCMNKVFSNPDDVCLNKDCQKIMKNDVVCSEPISEVYKAALSLFCSKDDNDHFCPYHEAVGKFINHNDLKQNVENEEALKRTVKKSCNIEECKTSFYNNIKSIIVNSILIGDMHYEDITTNKLYNEFLSLCE